MAGKMEQVPGGQQNGWGDGAIPTTEHPANQRLIFFSGLECYYQIYVSSLFFSPRFLHVGKKGSLLGNPLHSILSEDISSIFHPKS